MSALFYNQAKSASQKCFLTPQISIKLLKSPVLDRAFAFSFFIFGIMLAFSYREVFMKMPKFLFTVAFVLICALSQTLFAQNRAVLNQAQKITGDVFRVAATTPRGAQVYAVNRPNARTLAAIDDGLTNLFALARRNNYQKRLNYSDYTIYIARPDRTQDSNRQYSPDIAVGAAQYAGTIYDKGGYIYAAGMVISNNPCAFVIAEHARNFERIAEVVRYEGEHLVLYHNDRRRYNQTADHNLGVEHPILQ
jgi:hypothetical protein